MRPTSPNWTRRPGSHGPSSTPRRHGRGEARGDARARAELSPESYLGYGRAVGFASPGGVVPDERHVYSAPAGLRPNQWALSGDWRIGVEPALLEEPGGSLVCRLRARDLHLVMGPPAAHAPTRFRVRLDGDAPGSAHGVDVDESGDGTADYQRLYQLIRQPAPIGERLFEVEFLDAGVETFVFTFG